MVRSSPSPPSISISRGSMFFSDTTHPYPDGGRLQYAPTFVKAYKKDYSLYFCRFVNRCAMIPTFPMTDARTMQNPSDDQFDEAHSSDGLDFTCRVWEVGPPVLQHAYVFSRGFSLVFGCHIWIVGVLYQYARY